MPSPVKNPNKFSAASRKLLTAEETEEDHPDVKEIRRRVWGIAKEMVQLDLV